MILATLCYVRQNGKTLMIHRVKKENDFHEGKWNGLGGKFEPGESPEQCAIREIMEESGLVAKRLSMKGILTFPNFDTINDWYAFVFVVDDHEGELIDSAEGELEWIENRDLEKLNLWEGDRFFLPWLDQENFFSAKFVYVNGEYISHEVKFY